MFLTIDPGIHNLAMCIGEASDPSDYSTYNIVLLKNYNIIDETRTCCGILKNGNICGKQANCKYKNNDESNSLYHYTCKTHFPSTIKFTRLNKYKPRLITNISQHELAQTINKSITDIFNNNESIFKCITKVFIELQPKLNPKMKFVSHLIFGKLCDLFDSNGINACIQFIRASQKLKAYKGEAIECNIKNAYVKRKYLSVEYTKKIILNFNQQQQDFINKCLCDSKKMNDMTDTFLMMINAIKR